MPPLSKQYCIISYTNIAGSYYNTLLIQLLCVNDTSCSRVTAVYLCTFCNFIIDTSLYVSNVFNIFASALQNTRSMPHQGEILQEAIKNSGISITRIVEELGITRPTIYRKFKDETVDYNFVRKIGDIINHDFSNDFTPLQQSFLPFVSSIVKPIVTNGVTSNVTPRVTQVQNPDSDPAKQLLALQVKYIALLEAYNELLLKVYGPK